jgi:hypothetical protein
MVYAETGLPNLQHAPKFYRITGALFPLFLVPIARAGKLRWPATMVALTYMSILIVMNWVLIQVPATPKLAPIYNPVTHLVPPGFPILLVGPALVVDLLLHRFPRGRDWLLAPAIGVAFIATLVLIQWPFSAWLLSLPQPNPVLGVGYWEYGAQLGSWTTSFFDVPGLEVSRTGQVGTVQWQQVATGLLVAAGLATLSTRVGLWWGSWMERVKR